MTRRLFRRALLHGRWPVLCLLFPAIAPGCASPEQGFTDEQTRTAAQMQAAVLVAPVVESAKASIETTLEVALARIQTAETAGRDINKNSGWLLAFMAVVPYVSGKLSWLVGLALAGRVSRPLTRRLARRKGDAAADGAK